MELWHLPSLAESQAYDPGDSDDNDNDNDD
jgi:hypothetical protein